MGFFFSVSTSCTAFPGSVAETRFVDLSKSWETSPRYNRTGWLGVKHQVTSYLGELEFETVWFYCLTSYQNGYRRKTKHVFPAGSISLMKWCLMSSDVGWHIKDKLRPMPKHGSINLYRLRPRKPEGSLGRTTQDGHLDSHSSWTMTISISDLSVLYISIIH